MEKCFDIVTAPVCYNNGAYSETLTAFYDIRMDANGAPIMYAVRFARADGTLVDTTDGTISAGACCCAGGTGGGDSSGATVIPTTQTPSPDVEWSVLCDFDEATGEAVQFFRRAITYFNSDGSPNVDVSDWALDKITAYTPTGEVGICSPQEVCSPATQEGVVTSW